MSYCILSPNTCQLSIKAEKVDLASSSGCDMLDVINLDQMYEACKVFLTQVKVKRDPLLVSLVLMFKLYNNRQAPKRDIL